MYSYEAESEEIAVLVKFTIPLIPLKVGTFTRIGGDLAPERWGPSPGLGGDLAPEYAIVLNNNSLLLLL